MRFDEIAQRISVDTEGLENVLVSKTLRAGGNSSDET